MTGNSKFDPMIQSLENHLTTVKGETYKFVDGTKKASLIARKSLLAIIKIAKELRKEIQNTKVALPIRRRNVKQKPAEATPAA